MLHSARARSETSDQRTPPCLGEGGSRTIGRSSFPTLPEHTPNTKKRGVVLSHSSVTFLAAVFLFMTKLDSSSLITFRGGQARSSATWQYGRWSTQNKWIWHCISKAHLAFGRLKEQVCRKNILLWTYTLVEYEPCLTRLVRFTST